jgi:hypothetical protein
MYFEVQGSKVQGFRVARSRFRVAGSEFQELLPLGSDFRRFVNWSKGLMFKMG